MPAAHDRNLGQIAITEGLVSEEEVNAALAEMRQAEKIGAVTTLDTVLVKKGLLSRQQADALLEILSKKNIPTMLGGFEILERIGRGGMHAVYKARQVAMDRIVALKILSSQFTKDRRHVERLFKEARAAAKLSHVNIIQAIDAGEASGYYYFASEYVQGESVAEKLRREGVITESETLAIVEQVCLALIHIQKAAGKIHGDIKPANIMLTPAGVAKLVDLGLANTIQGADQTLICSPQYTSPEQIRRSPNIDFHSDIYSLGATIFHMISGKPPYEGSNARAILSKHISAPTPELTSIGSAPSDGLCTLVQKMLAKNPAERHQSLDELLADIRRLQNPVAQPVIEERIVRVPPARPSHTPAIVAAAIAVAAIAAVVLPVVVLKKKPAPPENVQRAVENSSTQAADALAAVDAFAEYNPKAYVEIAQKYRQVARRYPSAEQAAEAARLAEYYAGTHEKHVQQTLDSVRRRAHDFAEQERFAEAVHALRSFPDELHTTATRKALAAEETGIVQKATARAVKLLDEARQLADLGEYDAAIARLETGRKFGSGNVNERIDQLIAAYREKAAGQAKEEEAKLSEEFDKVIASAAVMMRQHRFEYAMELLDAFAVEHRDVDLDVQLNGEFAAMRQEIGNAQETWAGIVRSMRAKIGGHVSMRVAGMLLEGTLQEVDTTTFTIAIRDTPMVKELADIDTEVIFDLAGIAGDGGADALKRVQFYLTAADIDNALKAARTLPDRNLSQQWAVRITKRSKLLADYEHASRIEERLAQTREALDAGDATQAYAAIYPLRKMPDIPGELQQQATRLLADTEAALAAHWGIEYQQEQIFILLDNLRQTFKWMNENECPKTMPCPACEGKGYRVAAQRCPNCGGTGTVRCPLCLGRGYTGGAIRVQCMNCRGSGRVGCGTCNGRGVVPHKYKCNVCNGEKNVTCNICHGTGFKEEMPLRHEEALNQMKFYRISKNELEQLFAQ